MLPDPHAAVNKQALFINFAGEPQSYESMSRGNPKQEGIVELLHAGGLSSDYGAVLVNP
jgi:hypothetical protein